MTISTKNFVAQCKEARDLSCLLADNISVMNNTSLAGHQTAHANYQQEIAKTLIALETMTLSASEEKDMDMARTFLLEIVKNNGAAVKNARNSQAMISSELSGFKTSRSALSGYGKQFAQASQGRLVQRLG